MATFRLAAEGTYCGQQVVNVYHYLVQEEPPTTYELASAWDTGVTPYYNQLCAADYVGVMIRVWNLNSTTYSEIPWDMVGARNGDGLPPQNAAVISWRTGTPGRSYRGRNYITGISESDQSKGVLGALYLNDFENLANALQTIVTGTGYATLCVHSETHNVDTIVDSHVLRSTIRTQRRRSIGVGA